MHSQENAGNTLYKKSSNLRGAPCEPEGDSLNNNYNIAPYAQSIIRPSAHQSALSITTKKREEQNSTRLGTVHANRNSPRPHRLY
jgi:hypothetical protein